MAETQARAEAPSFRILIAEDSRTQAERLRYVLEQQGYEVAVAANGRLALEALPQFRPDLIISDVNMPEIDGYQLSQQVKTTAATREIPVILVTTMSDPQDVIRGLECGADNFVLKPYDERYMVGRVRYVLANREMRRPDDAGMGVGIFFNGQRHFITADRLQILNLLLSTYDAAIQRNKELTLSKESLEKRSAEVALANRFLDSVIENIPHMIFVKDADDLRFVRVNRALEELVGHTKEEMLGKSDFDFFPAAEAQAFTAKDREVLATGGSVGFDEPIHTADKGVRTLHTRKISILDESGRPRFLLGISEDVTARNERSREILRLNAALELRTAEADAASRAKSTFLATMSHEIRTPLNGLLGMLELLSLSRLDAEQRATLEAVRQSSASLLRIVDDVLDFSKIEAGQLEIHPEPASLRTIVEEVERMFAAAARSKGLELSSTVDPEISREVLVDPVRLKQILSNFVSNALKFTPQGSIGIRVERLGQEGGLEQLRFVVADTGIGISAENRRRLFQPFSQGDAEAARRAGGTGLGLSICRRLAALMGGQVEMESELGRGTTMLLTLALPAVAAREAPAGAPLQAPSSASPAAGGSRIAPDVAQAEAEGTLVLVVDDHPINRMLLLGQMNALGYAAESASDGAEGLEKWSTGRFGLVMTDCEMPVMDGYELALAIRAREAGNGGERTPVIACTAHALQGEALKCIAAGMDDCVVKPIDLARLRAKLTQWLPLPAAATVQPDAAAAASTGAGDPLDLSLIASTWGGDAGTVRNILEFFQRTNSEDAALLRQALATSDLLRISQMTHRMAGAGRMIGAVDYADACESIGRAGRAGDLEAVQAGVGEFEQRLERLNGFIASQAGGEP